MTLQTFSSTVISPVDLARMRQGEIIIPCERCKKVTWHKVYILRNDGTLILKTPRYNRIGEYKGHTERYECLACETTKTVRFKPKKMRERVRES